jgi:lysyl-tRNA synthetase, class II
MSIPHYIQRYGADGVIKSGTKLEGQTEALAGRVHNVRQAGQNLRFYDLHADGQKVQIMATKQYVL